MVNEYVQCCAGAAGSTFQVLSMACKGIPACRVLLFMSAGHEEVLGMWLVPVKKARTEYLDGKTQRKPLHGNFYAGYETISGKHWYTVVYCPINHGD
jgi:hypothetical protein